MWPASKLDHVLKVCGTRPDYTNTTAPIPQDGYHRSTYLEHSPSFLKYLWQCGQFHPLSDLMPDLAIGVVSRGSFKKNCIIILNAVHIDGKQVFPIFYDFTFTSVKTTNHLAHDLICCYKSQNVKYRKKTNKLSRKVPTIFTNLFSVDDTIGWNGVTNFQLLY